ncbi:MAG TPA: DNA methyltransferase [Gaiellaceae bacterium]|nr:DNA methyltransferase [Gaiellaceae bacterium]
MNDEPQRERTHGPKQRNVPLSSENRRPVAPVSYLETGVLHCGDNLDLLGQFPSECIDLVYLDPPFFSNRQYEVIWGDEAEVRSFEDRWKGGIEHYIEWMRQRATQLHRVLKPAGSLYLHCDPAASHYLKVMLDKVFGGDHFLNEVIWKRTGAHNSAKRYGPVHDTILFYAKSDSYTWNPMFTPHDPDSAYVKSHYTQVDPDGRLWMPDNLTAMGVRNGSSGLPWHGFDVAGKGNHWKFTIENLERLDAEGRIYWPSRGGWPRYKRYLDEVKGTQLQDIWIDIGPVNAKAREREGYPTQKPEALLDRVIEASSNRGDVILDPFCGCGTTVTVAERLNRQWIGIDISPTAARVMRRRLQRQGVYPAVYGLPETEDDLRKLPHFEFQNWIVDVLHGTHAPRKSGDMGIDGYSFFERLPIQVKQQDKVGRETVDLFETAIRREGKDRGYVVAFSFGRGAYQEVARAKSEGLNIALVTVATLLNNPDDKPLDPKLDDLTATLLIGAREAASKNTPQQAPPRTAEELIASVRD